MLEKRYLKDNEKLVSEWDWEKNNELGYKPELLSQGSKQKVWWICAKGHSYEAQIRNRVNGNGCSYCAGKKVLKGYNDLETFFPEVASEWNYDKNIGLTPAMVVFGSNKKVWWRCKVCEGEYESTIINRTNRNVGCPYCAGQKVLVGFNDLQTKNPDLAVEWSGKNTLKPAEVTLHSKRKVFWICPLGHDDYLMSITQRSRRQGCPVCAQQSQTSFPEQAIYFYLKKVFPDALNRYIVDKRELDIFIPSKKMGVEYNGYFSHKKKEEKDAEKKNFFNSKGIHIVVIKEYKSEKEKQNADYFIHERTTYRMLSTLIKELLISFDADSTDVNCERDAIAIKNQYISIRKENSIATLRPDLVELWDYEKNGSITPEMVTLGTGQRFYWKCRICNCSYLNWPSRIAQGSVCSKHHNILKIGENDLATTHPELLKYWDYEKNTVEPSEIYGGGERIVYWRCEKGHSYTKPILKHIRGEGCPFCAGKRVLAGFNDLLSQKPKLAEEWDYELNDCKPDEIHYNNQSKNIHWICSSCGYKWEYKVSNRINCPACEQKKKQINLYDATDLTLLSSFDGIKSICEYLGLDYKKQHGNISAVCHRKQKTLLGKYVLRYASDDEFYAK